MEDTEHNNAKFVEFWVPVQISNLQLEQYCSTLLSDGMALRSGSKTDSVEALHNILKSNRKVFFSFINSIFLFLSFTD